MDLSPAPKVMAAQPTRREQNIATKQRKKAKKMQSQMQSQAKSSPTMPSNLLKIMVSRAGLEPATTALKVRCSTN